jgi:hypothetical protein
MNIEELKRLAQAATPGPWAVNDDPLINEGAPHLMTKDGYAIADFWGNESSLGLKGNERNAAYIAAANPAAVLDLIQQRDELLAALKEARELVEDWGAYAPAYMQEKHDLHGDLSRLDAAIAKAEG